MASTNSRIFYAVESFGITEYTKDTDPTGAAIEAPRGVQSVTIDTSFSLEQVFELGQLDIYENIETLPDISITTSKVLDGTKPIYFMATKDTENTLNGKNADSQCLLWLNIYDESQTAASGTQLQSVMGSGMYLSDISYTFPVEGDFTEEITFVGNDKYWYNQPIANSADTSVTGNYNFTVPSGDFDNTDDAGVIGSGVQRRENLMTEFCTFPEVIPGMTTVNAASTRDAAQTALEEHLQSISVSASLGREDIFQLGQKKAYYKFIAFPLEVTCSFECISSEGDKISADSRYDNLTNETIILKTNSGLALDLGTSNKLSDISYGGGDTGGANVTITYNFTNQNKLDIRPCSPETGALQNVADHAWSSITDNGTV